MPTVPLLASVADLSASQIAGAASQLVPSGVVMPFAGATAPSGWLLCEGALVSRTTYANLFAAISTAHGTGDGSTTFALPNYAGRFLRGRANASANDPDRASRTAAATGGATGDAVGSVQGNATARPSNSFISGAMSANADHSHSLSQPLWADASGDRTFTSSGPLNIRGGLNVSANSTNIAHTHTITSGGDNETRPTNAYVNYIIKI